MSSREAIVAMMNAASIKRAVAMVLTSPDADIRADALNAALQLAWTLGAAHGLTEASESFDKTMDKVLGKKVPL